MGMHKQVTKYCCFFCIWDNQSRSYCKPLWKATFVDKKPICSCSEQCAGA